MLWVIVAGLMFRGALPYPDSQIMNSLLMAAFLFFPFCVLIAALRSDISLGRCCVVVLIEAGLTYAYFLAILPGVQ